LEKKKYTYRKRWNYYAPHPIRTPVIGLNNSSAHDTCDILLHNDMRVLFFFFLPTYFFSLNNLFFYNPEVSIVYIYTVWGLCSIFFLVPILICWYIFYCECQVNLLSKMKTSNPDIQEWTLYSLFWYIDVSSFFCDWGVRDSVSNHDGYV